MSESAHKKWDDFMQQVQKLPPLTPEQEREHKISFVYGNINIENPLVTREMVEKLVDKEISES